MKTSKKDSISRGFIIHKTIDAFRWKSIDMSTVPLLEDLHCVCGESPLTVFASLVNTPHTQSIRIGICSYCGYMTYIDKPEKKWVEHFYMNTWDVEPEQSSYDKASKQISQPGAVQRLVEKSPLVSIINKLSLDQNRSILEIGCGYGYLLSYLKRRGYNKLIGIEHSPIRADVTKQVYNINVITDSFESDTAQKELINHDPFQLIYSSHVLEHVYNPAEMVAKISKLQKIGDHVILSMPNNAGEPSMGILTFLPHLNSFTIQSLRNLMNRNSYEVIQDFTNEHNITMCFRKVAVAEKFNNIHNDYVKQAERKFINGLSLQLLPKKRYCLFIWRKSLDSSFYTLATRWTIINKLILYFIRVLFITKALRSVLVSSLEKRFTNEQDSIFEFQFKKNITLYYK